MELVQEVPVWSPANVLSFNSGEQITDLVSSKRSCLIPSWRHFFLSYSWMEGFFLCQVMGILVLIFLLSCVCLFSSLHVASGY